MGISEWITLIIVTVVAFGVGVIVGMNYARNRATASSALSEPTAAQAPPGSDHAGSVNVRPQAAIIYNPTKQGAAEFVATAKAVSRQEGWNEPEFLSTTVEDPGKGQAQKALGGNFDVIIAAGGDGTVRNVAEALAGTSTPMGIVPMGTGNLLARNLNLPLGTPEWALRIALWGQDRGVDAAHLKLSPEDTEKTFMVMAGVGYDAAVMADTDEVAKDRRGWFAYVETGSRKLTGSRTRVEVSYDGKPGYSARVRSLLVGNCGKVQGGVELIPGAEIDDGFLDVLSVTPKNIAEWIGVVAAVAGKKHRGPHTSVTKCEKIVMLADEELDIQLDGDSFGKTDYLEVRVDPLALSVRTPTTEQRRRIRRELNPLLLS